MGSIMIEFTLKLRIDYKQAEALILLLLMLLR